jgi:hypothetical protein
VLNRASKHTLSYFYRIMRFVQSGLTTKWIEMAKMSFKKHQYAKSLSGIKASKVFQCNDICLISNLLGSESYCEVFWQAQGCRAELVPLAGSDLLIWPGCGLCHTDLYNWECFQIKVMLYNYMLVHLEKVEFALHFARLLSCDYTDDICKYILMIFVIKCCNTQGPRCSYSCTTQWCKFKVW